MRDFERVSVSNTAANGYPPNDNWCEVCDKSGIPWSARICVCSPCLQGSRINAGCSIRPESSIPLQSGRPAPYIYLLACTQRTPKKISQVASSQSDFRVNNWHA
ncbi:hypothetical protein L202_05862 [Cryptococcus amylolentus CBS 6039]|uniref:Uncharacterized protein n=1 Tax=Cryptococcus amylolentus CBS 6039 TaxID=1295533 RepID=A0A1E3HHQ9_9TREE|nr:hypothetical protein L202_05862 [Cryptococcus amylolentus CBS 6039]ODN75874.1 hypothetical protein L202_05862 [Cryptococcus amylolentus CBS 6039]